MDKDRTYVYGNYQYEIVGDDEQGYEIQKTDLSPYNTSKRGAFQMVAWFKELADAHKYCFDKLPAVTGRATMEAETFTNGFVQYRITEDRGDGGFDVYEFDLTTKADGRRVGWFESLGYARAFCHVRTDSAAAPSVMTSGKPMDFTESRRNLRISDLFRIRRDYFGALEESRRLMLGHSGAHEMVQAEALAELIQSDAENRYIHLTLFAIGELEKLDGTLIPAPFGFSDGGE